MPNANLYALLARGFDARSVTCAIETRSPKGAVLYYSWRDIDRATACLANLLTSLSLPADARVAVQVEKSVESLLLYLACLRAGLVYLPLNNAYQEAEIDYFVGNAEPGVIVCSPQNQAWIKKVAKRHGVGHVFTLDEDRGGSLLAAASQQADRFVTAKRQPGDLAAILYTSGTTGRSKGAMLSHGNLSSNTEVLLHYWRWRRGDVLIHALPIFHVHGLFVASHCALMNGSKMLWHARFDADAVIRDMARATVFMGVPTMYVRLLDAAALDTRSTAGMRLFISGSAPLLPDTFRQFEQRTGQRILERYGMSETLMLTSNPYDGNRIAGTVGLPLPGVSARVCNEQGKPLGCEEIGGIEVKGPNVFSGYWRMPEKTREEFTADGFFRTGDVGKWDANGYLSIVGRSKDLIISGGYNVYPKEIESYLDEMDGVFESAVIGVPHRDFGEAVTAVVIPKPGASLVEGDLIAALKARIANFKVPKRIFVVDALPRNQMGKVQKNLLRERFGG